MATQNKGLLITDLETGEEIYVPSSCARQLVEAIRDYADVLDRMEKNASMKREPPFIMLKQKRLEEISAEKSLKLSDRRVLDLMLSKAKYGGKIAISQKGIAETLGMQVPTVSRCVRRLVEHGLIFNADKEAGRPVYIVSKTLGRKGAAKIALVGSDKPNLKVHQGGKS